MVTLHTQCVGTGEVREDESRTWKGLDARERRIMRKAAVYS